jgi:hypothetical protein
MGVCVLAGCGKSAAVPEPSAPSAAKSTETVRVAESISAERNHTSLPAFDDRFAVTRQVTALERSIELYQTFIERAGDDPRYEEAVRRSRGRIDDARVTICFLLEKPCDASAAP